MNTPGTKDAVRDPAIPIAPDRYASPARVEPTPPPEAALPAIHWAGEALEPQPPIDWVVEGLFSAGSVSEVFGLPGCKKTWLLLDAAVCVAMGRPWLAHTTKQATVLVVDEESGPSRLKRRLNDLMKGHQADSSLPLAYVSLARINLRTPEGVTRLRGIIKQTGARFVVIDALADIMVGYDENAVKDTQPVFMELRSIAEETGAAIVVIHHAGKNGQSRGSSAIPGAVDLELKVTSKQGSSEIELNAEKPRDVEPFKISAGIRFEEDRVTIGLRGDTNQPQRFNRAKEYVLRYLLDHGPSLLTEIANHADVCDDKAARKAAKELADIGLVERTDGGGAGARATYALTEKGQGVAGGRQPTICKN